MESLGLEIQNENLSYLQGSAKRIIEALGTKALENLGVDTGAEKKNLTRRFLETRVVRIYLDDLDRGWSASSEDINNLSALMNAIRDLTNEAEGSLQVRIGLRSDAYYLYRTSDESTDKIEGNVIRLTWSRHDVLVVMALRVAHYFGKEIDAKEFENRAQTEISRELFPIIEDKFSVGRGHWNGAPIQVVLLSLNRNRPRDLVKLLTESAKEAFRHDHKKISATDLENTFSNYSHGRITDLNLEYKSELPEIEKLIYGMKPTTQQQKAQKNPGYIRMMN